MFNFVVFVQGSSPQFSFTNLRQMKFPFVFRWKSRSWSSLNTKLHSFIFRIYAVSLFVCCVFMRLWMPRSFCCALCRMKWSINKKILSRRAFEDVILFCRVCHAHEFLTVAVVNSNKYGNGANWIDWCAIEEIVGILSRIVRLTPKRSIEITVNHFILIMRRTYWRNFCTMTDIIKYYSQHAFWFYNY